MVKQKLFQYVILWHPLEKQVKDEGAKSKILTGVTYTLAVDIGAASMAAAMEIPQDYKTQLDQIEIAVRPF